MRIRWLGRPRTIASVDGPIRWLHSSTAKPGKELGVEPPCTGSPNCAGAIHLRSADGRGTWLELHMGAQDMRNLRALIDDCLAVYQADGRPS